MTLNKQAGRILKGRAAWLAVMLVLGTLLLPGCKTMSINYSFSGVNISPKIQTVTIEYFPNRAPVVQAQLSQLFTDALVDKIQSNTSLEQVPAGGDLVFSGEIRNYETKPTAITGNETAARNRLTISIRVVYTNNIEPDASFDSSFSRYEDYDSGQNLADVEEELIELIIENILEDIFNKAFVNW
ncbi:MAG: LptE family protein [Bacteroidales bacterium]|nr:LptE family protein [Bacteroidales bacterium]MDT8432706.1 LptE family protein [Bacteroidales bacterium]